MENASCGNLTSYDPFNPDRGYFDDVEWLDASFPVTLAEARVDAVSKGSIFSGSRDAGFTVVEGGESVYANQTLTFTGQPLNTETVSIDSKVYTFQTSLTSADGNVVIGADSTATRNNLRSAINLEIGSGSTYGSATTLHPSVTANNGVTGVSLLATAKENGTLGNTIQTTDTATNVAWGAASLASGTDILFSGARVLGAQFAFNDIFFCEGANYRRHRLDSNTVVAWDATTGLGTLPGGNGTDAGDGSERARIIALWQGRIVLAGVSDQSSDIFMSRIGNPFDWDFLGATDNSAAFQLSAASTSGGFGLIGDIVTAIIPFRERLLMVGGQHTLNILNGNPREDGSSLLNFSERIGIAGPHAWTIGKDRTLYFWNSDGLYELRPNEFSVDQSNRVGQGALDSVFRDIDLSENQIRLEWNPERHGVDLYITPLVEGPTIHFYYDSRTTGFFPQRLPEVVGPTATLSFDADKPNDRAIILGGFDGHIRFLQRNTNHDDGTTIESNIMIGPIFSPYSDREIIISKLKTVLDDLSDSVKFEVLVGDSAQAAAAADPSFSGTWTAGRNPAVYDRARGAVVFIRISNTTFNTTWAMEQITARLMEAGQLRVR